MLQEIVRRRQALKSSICTQGMVKRFIQHAPGDIDTLLGFIQALTRKLKEVAVIAREYDELRTAFIAFHEAEPQNKLGFYKTLKGLCNVGRNGQTEKSV